MLEKDDNGVYTEELINGTRRPLDAFDAQGDVMQEVTKEYADRFLASYRKQVAGRLERSESRAYCAGGEGSGIDPSCGGGGGGGGGKTAKLPQDHGKYFTKVVAPSAKYDEVPIGALDAIRARPDGIANANKFMREAYEGKNSPREPISVVKSGDRYKVMDGNSTFANAKQAGWTTLPVQVFKTEEDAKAHEKQKKEAKEAKKKAAKRAYCAGGPGGGIDPSCGSGKSDGGGVSVTDVSAGSTFEKELHFKAEGGVIKVAKSKFSPADWSVVETFVDEDKRRQGIASKLIEKVKQKLKGSIAAQASSDNSVALFWKHGFRPLGGGTISDAKKSRKEDSSVLLVYDPQAPAARATLDVVESRAMTISIDFDKTFSADPKLWGEFAMKSEAEGNTIVMISRREDTPKNQKEIADTIGEHMHAFSHVMLIGADALKADAAAAAGINVNVWIDDSPQTVRG